MNKMNRTPDLLEQLTALVGCEYLSELKQPRYHEAICAALNRIPADSFSEKEWMETASYLICERNDALANSLYELVLAHGIGE